MANHGMGDLLFLAVARRGQLFNTRRQEQQERELAS